VSKKRVCEKEKGNSLMRIVGLGVSKKGKFVSLEKEGSLMALIDKP
jgi:hypothetical protein